MRTDMTRRARVCWRIATGGLFGTCILCVATTAWAIDFKQWVGCGYGPGYNAPGQSGQYNTWPNCPWWRGCCDVPATWRTHVWDGYTNPYACWGGAAAAGPGYGYGGYPAGGNCPTCGPQGAAGMGPGYGAYGPAGNFHAVGPGDETIPQQVPAAAQPPVTAPPAATPPAPPPAPQAGAKPGPSLGGL